MQKKELVISEFSYIPSAIYILFIGRSWPQDLPGLRSSRVVPDGGDCRPANPGRIPGQSPGLASQR